MRKIYTKQSDFNNELSKYIKKRIDADVVLNVKKFFNDILKIVKADKNNCFDLSVLNAYIDEVSFKISEDCESIEQNTARGIKTLFRFSIERKKNTVKVIFI